MALDQEKVNQLGDALFDATRSQSVIDPITDQIPDIEIDAFFNINSTTLLAVLMSGRDFITGERP